MSFSPMLLIVAVACALAPLLSTALRPPRRLRDIEKCFVVGVAVLTLGTLLVSRVHPMWPFGLIHLGYLLVVVTLPFLGGAWFVGAVVQRRRTTLLDLAGLGAGLLALAGLYGTHIEPNWLRTDRVDVLAPVQRPITIGVIADLQTPNVGEHEWNAIERVLAESPDVVLVPGDLFQGDRSTIERNSPAFVELLEALVLEVPVVAVVSGDSENFDQLVPMIDAAGATYLDNTVVETIIDGTALRIGGVAVRSGPERLETLAALTEPSDAFTILVSHRPDIVYELPLTSDIDLIVAGHTHGGQVSLPFFGPPVTFTDVPRDLAAGGIGTVDDFVLYVSTGVGIERREAPQLRFGVRPSVGIITVRAPQPSKPG